ncbi:MAG: hypothetical protein QNJ31_08260 [Candidatus Caenarcaniphilales bacterium]|nr:hypothetical protein [Candidatus Caenarcaniphilales bacterium]
MLKIFKSSYKNWNTTTIEKDDLTLVLLPEVGGRIISMQWKGKELSFQQPERLGKTEDLQSTDSLPEKKKQMGFPLWGGDKTWLAPQFRWNDGVPFVDLDSGEYFLKIDKKTEEEIEVSMKSPICRETRIQITRTIKINSREEGWQLTHEFLNTNSYIVQWGIWDVNMVLRPGKVYLPISKNSKFDEGIRTYKEEGESELIRDKVVKIYDDYAEINCSEETAFKFGSDSKEGWLMGVLETDKNNFIGYLKQFETKENSAYAHESVCEVYNSNKYNYFEMEIHAPLVPIPPNKKVTFIENQKIFDLDSYPSSIEEIKSHFSF